MHRTTAVAAAALTFALGFSAPAFARAPAPAPSPAQQVAAEVQVWLSRVSEWARPYNEAFTRNTGILGELDAGVVSAFEHYENGDEKAGRAWAETWAKSMRTDLADFRSDIAGLNAVPPTPPATLSGEPRLAEMTRRLGSLPNRMVDYVDRSEKLANQIIGLGERTARGDDDAAVDLAHAVFALNIATLESENEVLASAKSMIFTEGHPQQRLIDASIAANLGMVAIVEAQRDLALEELVGGGDVAARLRQHADQIEAAAAAMEREARALSDQMRSARELQGAALFGTIERAMASYQESAQVERAVAAGYRDIATRLDREEALDFDELTSATEALVPLFEKRAALDQARRNLFAAT